MGTVSSGPAGRHGEGGRPEYFVQSLDRGFAVIRAFSAEAPALTAAEVARRSGLDRAAVRRFLLTLIDLGYVQTDGRLYSLRPRILELGYAYLSSLSLPEIAQPHMERLVAAVHETCSLGVLDGSDVVFVSRVATRRVLTVPIIVGSRFPALATSMGRVLLGALPDDKLAEFLERNAADALTTRTVTDPDQLRVLILEARDQGYAMVDMEMDEVTRSVAVPVFGAGGTVVAALNLSTLSTHGSAQDIRSRIPDLIETAASITADLRPGLTGSLIG